MADQTLPKGFLPDKGQKLPEGFVPDPPAPGTMVPYRAGQPSPLERAPLMKQSGESDPDFMKRAVAAGRQVTPSQIQHETSEEIPKIPLALAAGPVEAGLQTWSGPGAVMGAGTGTLGHIGWEALHGRLPHMQDTLEAAGSGALAGAIAGPYGEGLLGKIVGKIGGRYLPEITKEAPQAAQTVEAEVPKMTDKIVKTPEEFRAAERIMKLAEQRAKERGMQYAAGMKP